MSRFRSLPFLVVCLCLSIATPSAATLRVELPYTRQQVFSCALRYLRVELGSEITEKDAEAAYLLFLYQAADARGTSPGAVEMVERGASTTLVVRLPRLPAYHETLLKDGLVRKLQEDYGANRPSKPKRAPESDEPSKDGSKDSLPNPSPKESL
jgi:hypothetical protein